MAGNSNIPEDTLKRLDAAVQRWIDTKAFLFPDPTPSESAKRIGTTSAMLHKYFIEVMGEDFRTFRSRLRIEEAKKLLLEKPQLPLSTVGRQVGIEDRSNFQRQFQAVTGEIPSEWRKNHQKNLHK